MNAFNVTRLWDLCHNSRNIYICRHGEPNNNIALVYRLSSSIKHSRRRKIVAHKMPVNEKQNTEPKDEGKELESTVHQPEENITVTEEAAPVREITQTDRINRRLLVSLLENMNKHPFFDMTNPTGSDAVESSESPENDGDWKWSV